MKRIINKIDTVFESPILWAFLSVYTTVCGLIWGNMSPSQFAALAQSGKLFAVYGTQKTCAIVCLVVAFATAVYGLWLEIKLHKEES